MSAVVTVEEIREALGERAIEYSELELAQLAGTCDLLARWALEEEFAGDTASARPAA